MKLAAVKFLMVVAALLCAVPCSFGQTDVDATAWGPAFGQRSLFVLHVPLLDFGPADPELPPPGRFRWSIEGGYANSFSHSWHAVLFHEFLGPAGTPFRRDEAERIHSDFPGERVWFIDGDVLRSSLAARVGLTPTTVVSLEVPYISHAAFTGDHFVGGFHRVFGLSQAGRADVPPAGFIVMAQSAGGALAFSSDSPESGAGDIVATFGWRPLPLDSGRSFGLDLAVKAPTGRARDFNGSGGWDAGALFFLARSGTKWRVETEGGIVIPGGWNAPVPISTAPFGRVLVGVTRRFGARTRIGASFTVEQSPFRRAGLETVSKTGAEFGLGMDRDLSRWTARFLLTEHLAAAGDRADIGLTMRVSYRP